MVDLAEIQAAYYMVAATGVLVAAIYYVMNLRISQRNQELMLRAQETSVKTQELALKSQEQTLETRQAQFFMQLYESLESPENQKRSHKLRKMEWKDFEDWYKKYFWTVNEDAYAQFASFWRRYDSFGFLIKNKLVDPVKMYEILGWQIMYNWDRYKEIILGLRER